MQDINGAFQPGVLTALVGVSGAGKTTLMDCLAGALRISALRRLPCWLSRVLSLPDGAATHSRYL